MNNFFKKIFCLNTCVALEISIMTTLLLLSYTGFLVSALLFIFCGLNYFCLPHHTMNVVAKIALEIFLLLFHLESHMKEASCT